MKKTFDDIFIKRYPTLDLHGYDRNTTVVAINEFINDNHKLHNHDLVIIHGIGQGIVKEAVFKTLAQNELVLEYKLHQYNLGMTIVKIK